MALQKNIESQSGAIATYHKIMENSIDWVQKAAVITMASYVDKNARDNDKAPLMYGRYQWGGGDFPYGTDESENIREVTYDKLKTLPEWADAVDC